MCAFWIFSFYFSFSAENKLYFYFSFIFRPKTKFHIRLFYFLAEKEKIIFGRPLVNVIEKMTIFKPHL